MHRLKLLAPLVIPLLLAPACKKGSGGNASATPSDEGPASYGYEDASSPDMAPIPHALADTDMEGVQARGMTLWHM